MAQQFPFFQRPQPAQQPGFGAARPAGGMSAAPGMARPMAQGYGGAAPGVQRPGMFAPGGMSAAPMQKVPQPGAGKVPQPGSTGALFGGGGGPQPGTGGLFGGGRAPAQARPGGFASLLGGGQAQQQQRPGGFAGLMGGQNAGLPQRAQMAPAPTGPRQAPSFGGNAMMSALSDERSKQEITRLREHVHGLGGNPDSGGGGAAGLAKRDYETYQGGMTPRAQSRDYGAFEQADRDAGMGGAGQGHQSNNPFAQDAPLIEGDTGNRIRRSAGFFGSLSDERSKEKIRELEAVRDRYEGLMGNDRNDTENAFRGVHDYEYEYKNPDAPGAAPGRQRGPMAHELRPLGVTHQGADGYERVDMQRLPLETAGEVGNQRRELDELRARLRELEGNPEAQLDVAGGRS